MWGGSPEGWATLAGTSLFDRRSLTPSSGYFQQAVELVLSNHSRAATYPRTACKSTATIFILIMATCLHTTSSVGVHRGGLEDTRAKRRRQFFSSLQARASSGLLVQTNHSLDVQSGTLEERGRRAVEQWALNRVRPKTLIVIRNPDFQRKCREEQALNDIEVEVEAPYLKWRKLLKSEDGEDARELNAHLELCGDEEEEGELPLVAPLAMPMRVRTGSEDDDVSLGSDPLGRRKRWAEKGREDAFNLKYPEEDRMETDDGEECGQLGLYAAGGGCSLDCSCFK